MTVRTTCLAAALCLLPALSNAEEFKIDPSHSMIVFQLNHLGFSQSIGWLGEVSGDISYKADNLSQSSVIATLAATSINTNHAERDAWIKSDKVLNVDTNPTISFVSTGIELATETSGSIIGDLTMNGMTKPVTLEATFNQVDVNPLSKKQTLGVSAKSVINRSDWGVTAFVGPLGDEVSIQVELEAIKAD